jgi:hypothetical protein
MIAIAPRSAISDHLMAGQCVISAIGNEPRAFSAALYCGQFVVWYRLRGVFVFIPPVSYGLSGWLNRLCNKALAFQLLSLFLSWLVVQVYSHYYSRFVKSLKNYYTIHPLALFAILS